MSAPLDREAGTPQVRVGGALTASERLIWTGQQLETSSPLYNMALCIEIPAPLDVHAFSRAFQQLVACTDALRTCFVEEDGQPRRVVRPALSARVEHLQIPQTAMDDAALATMLEARTRRLFPLDGVLFDCTLVERAPARFLWFLNQHHLITDAWSVGILHRRLSALYEKEVRAGEARETGGGGGGGGGRDTPSAGSTPQFGAFVEHQEALQGTPRLTKALAHWDGASTRGRRAMALYGRQHPGSGRTTRIRLRLGGDRAAALRRVAAAPPFRALTVEQAHFQLFATLLLSWLHRISDATSLAIGTPWHNRSTAALRETAGLFVELFPLDVTIDERETFASLGAKVAMQTRDVMRHVVPGASASPGARTFGVVLNYITAQLGDFAGVPVRADWIHAGAGDPEHRVRLQVHDFNLAGDPVLDFDLDESTFGEAEREWAVRHFLALFDALVAEPAQPIASVGLTSVEEERTFAPRGECRASPTSVLEMVWASARATPDAVAIREESRSLTYAEVQRTVQLLASRLANEGVGPETVVGVALERSAEMVLAMLGIMAAGGAFVPLDPAYPDARLAFLTRDAGASLVVTRHDLATRVRDWGARPLLVEADDATANGTVEADPMALPAPETLAYLLYTSGSTGQPKGVEVTHAAFADYVAWAARSYADAPGLVWPLFTSPAFDLTLTSIFTPLATGGSILVYPNEAGGSALLVRRVFEEDAVDVVKLTPSHLALLRGLELPQSRVRRLIVGGEDLTRSAALAAREVLGAHVEIFNEYGPTEATVACTLHRFDPDTDTSPSVPIGRPADNASIHVLDPDGVPVPRGVAGEICIGGPRVARGYRNRPDLTSRSFVADPFTEGGHLYRTGDVGRWLPDGALAYLGRRDEQVKVRGVRVELGEIEAALARHPAIEACAAVVSAVARPDDGARCRRCGLEGAHPEARLDDDSICAVCHRFEGERENVARYFGTMDDLRAILAEARREAAGPHDCLMLYSGGKDSTYALSRIVELGARPLVLLFDNGFISGQAKDNVRRVVETLGLELVIGETPAMPAIFAESLARFSNVCNGCYKAIYTVAMNVAVARGIRHIVTGLSRGQIFETRLADLYRRGVYDPDEVDRIILDARKAYHRMDDAVARGLDVSIFETDAVLDRIRFVDFYRYCDASLEEILHHVARRTPWIRPTDTGRSTNCLINQAGIFVHQRERGFHNYAMPYSWDVRLGHKERDAAVAELDDELDPSAIREMLDRVGYRPHEAAAREPRLVAYYAAAQEIPSAALRRFLEGLLPRDVIPSAFVRLEHLPLAASGKVDRGALPHAMVQRLELPESSVAPRTEMERLLADVWREVLDVGALGVHDDYFELGGDSMQCIQIVTAARLRGVSFAPRDLFANPTVAALAAVARWRESDVRARAATASDAELAEVLEEFGADSGASPA